jgi:hypothetical protein
MACSWSICGLLGPAGALGCSCFAGGGLAVAIMVFWEGAMSWEGATRCEEGAMGEGILDKAQCFGRRSVCVGRSVPQGVVFGVG